MCLPSDLREPANAARRPHGRQTPQVLTMRFQDRGDGPPDYQVGPLNPFKSHFLGIPIFIRSLVSDKLIPVVGQLHRIGRSPSNRTISVPNVPLQNALPPPFDSYWGNLPLTHNVQKCRCSDSPCGQCSSLGTLRPNFLDSTANLRLVH